VYSDDQAAALYDVLNPWGRSDAFYLELVLAAESVLDVGCGTGTLLQRAREAGHTGRMAGVDPDAARLRIARRKASCEWLECTAAAMPWGREFDLAVMTGHAFQELVGDEELRASLAGVRRALVDGGLFAFDTRNPHARAWEGWAAAEPIEVVDPDGRAIRVWYEVEPVIGDVVTFSEITGTESGERLRADRASLRFLDVEMLAGFLGEAGFEVEAQYGDWDGQALEPASPEIVTIARARVS
jgi:ubiquinone/menaquinone biosynthesis C-methylase UbiE